MSGRVYRALLRVLPRDIRDDFGCEIERLHEERMREAGSRRARAGAWMSDAADVIATGVSARVAPRFRATRGVHRTLADFPLEVRQAYASLARRRAYSAACIATLGLGLGAITAFFMVVNGVLLRPLPYKAGDRLAMVESPLITPSNIGEWQSLQRAFDETAAYTIAMGSGYTTTGGAAVRLMPVGRGFFDMLGTRAHTGRLFSPEDHGTSSSAVAVVSERFWRQFFPGESAVGHSLTIDDRTYRVTGTLPADFSIRFEDVDVWVPFETYSVRRASLLARIPIGSDVATAAARIATLAATIPTADERSELEPGEDAVQVLLLKDFMTGGVARTLWILLAAAGCVLLVSAANVATLSIGRALERREELAVRSALGASGGRIVWQLVIEAGILAFFGTCAGIALALAAPRLLAMAPNALPRTTSIHFDWRVASFAFMAAVACMIIFGLIPAVAVSRWNSRTSLRAETARGRRAGPAQSMLAMAEVAVAVVLLVSSALLMRTYVALRPSDPGFQVTDRVIAQIALPRGRYQEVAEKRAVTARVSSALHSITGNPRHALVTDVRLPVTRASRR